MLKVTFQVFFITRRLTNDGAKYFGPYANPGSAKEMIDFIKQRYKIRQCRTLKPRTRPCLNYHIGRCLAPCMGYVTKEEYKKQIDEIIDLLDGKTDKIIKELTEQMQIASQKWITKKQQLCVIEYKQLKEYLQNKKFLIYQKTI